jgi:hypothetical protein
MQTKYAYVLSNPPRDEEEAVYRPKSGDKLVLFPGADLLGTSSFESILENKDPETGLQYRLAGSETAPYTWGVMENGRVTPTDLPHTNVIPEVLGSQLGIYGGDKLTLDIDDYGKRVIIRSINGKPPVKVRSIYEMSEDYPRIPYPVDSFGFHSLRCVTSLAPLGRGFCGYLVAPGGSGKTSLMLELWEAAIRLTAAPRIVAEDDFVVGLLIGERPKDNSLYLNIKQGADHNPDRVEFFSAPIGKVTMAGQWRIFLYLATQRIRSLARHYNTVFLDDSIHRAAASDSFRHGRTQEERDGGMIAGGLSTESMIKVTEIISVTGSYGATSLSAMSVLLGNYKGLQQNNASALARISVESKDNVPDVLWGLVKNPMLDYPRLDPTEEATQTRRDWYFAHPKQIEELKLLKEIRWANENQAQDACRTVQDHARMLPIPPWIENPPSKPLTPLHLL